MPITYTKRVAPVAPPVDRIQQLRNLLGTGIRVGSGVLSSEGMVPGALISGAGEGLAELAEGSLNWHSPARIATEAAIGAVPLAKTLSTGRVLQSAAKTGAMSGLGDVGRQWAEGNLDPTETSPGWDWKRSAYATLMGGAAGGVAGKFGGTPAPPKAEPVVVENMGGGVPRTSKTPGAYVPAGQTTHSAGAMERGTPNYQGGIEKIEGYSPSPTTHTVTSGPRSQNTRITYGVPQASDAEGLMADLEAQFPSKSTEPALETSMMEMLNSIPRKPLTSAPNELADVNNALGAERARRGNRVEAVRSQTAQEAKETAKRDLIQRRRMAAGVEPETSFSSTVSSQTPTGVKETMTTKFRPPKADEADESVEALNTLLSGKTPEVAESLTKAARGASGRTTELLQNLDEEGMKYFSYLRNVMGDSDNGAYRKAIYEQQVRQARVSRPVAQVQPPVAPVAEAVAPTATPQVKELSKLISPTSKEVLEQSTHPSFYDNGVEGLENAADVAQQRQAMPPSMFDEGFDGLEDVSKNGRKAPPNGKPPAAAQAKLDAAQQTYQPEAMDELKRLSAIYNDPATDAATRKQTGKELKQLSDFMQGKGSKNGPSPLNPTGQRGAISPDVLLSTAMGLGGAAYGAAADDDNPVEGAILGGLGGAAIPLAPRLAASIGRDAADLNIPSKVAEMAKEIVTKIPQWQRFSLLADPVGLPANAWIGPYGSVLTGAIEGILKGDHRALPLLKAVWNPLDFAKQAFGNGANWDEAYDALRKGEMGREGFTHSGGQPLTKFDHMTLGPGLAMTAGDLHARRLLSQFGYSPDEARLMTMTSEPASKLGRSISNFGKGSWLGNLLMPFKRTPANMFESGLQRTPVVGAFADKLLGNAPRNLSNREALAEQLGGLAAGTVGYGVASATDDDGFVTNRGARRFVSNAAGRYALPTALGYILGTGHGKGRSTKQILKDPNLLTQLTPLPTTEPLQDLIIDPLYGSKQRPPGTGPISDAIGHIPNSLDMRALRSFLPGLADEPATTGRIRYVRRPQRQK